MMLGYRKFVQRKVMTETWGKTMQSVSIVKVGVFMYDFTC